MSAATWLPSVLRTGGCAVKTYKGWDTRGRPGEFAPFAVLWHHTGARTGPDRPAPSVGFCITGSAALAGPLCQVVIGYDGLCHVIAAGRANHAGTNDGTGTGPVPAGSGNAQFIGFEFDYSGSQDMGPRQWEAGIKATTAVLKHFGNGPEFCRGHKETSTAGKWDPGRKGSSSPEYHMAAVRAQVAEAMRPPQAWVRFEILTGEGQTLATSGRIGPKEATQKEKGAAFVANHFDIVYAELEHDRGRGEPEDVRVRRVWETGTQ